MGAVSRVLLDSQRVQPRIALDAGYRFMSPRIDAAFASLYGG